MASQLFCFSSLFFETDNLTDRNATSATMFLATMALLYVIASSIIRPASRPAAQLRPSTIRAMHCPASRLAAHTLDYSGRPMHCCCSPEHPILTRSPPPVRGQPCPRRRT